MSRPRKYTEEQLESHVKDFWENECKGDIRRLRYASIGAYLRSNGYPDITDIMLRRSQAVRTLIENIERDMTGNGLFDIVSYRTLDINELQHKSTSELRQIITARDTYYLNIFEYAKGILQENKKMKATISMHQKDARNHERENAEHINKEKELKLIIKKLKTENSKFRHLFKEYVYDEIGEKWLVQQGIAVSPSENMPSYTKDRILDSFIGIDTPMPHALIDNVVYGAFANQFEDEDDEK